MGKNNKSKQELCVLFIRNIRVSNPEGLPEVYT